MDWRDDGPMPWLLYRWMTADLLRLIVLTTSVLVTVIAFGATIKPLAGDQLLSMAAALKYLSLAIVPMLQFALPFAAGFAATITLHRMVAENEVLAMAASGISHARILAPVAAMGVLLTVFMFVLTQEVVPRFWSRIEQMVTMDIADHFAASIEQGRPFVLGDLQIHADRLVVEVRPEGTDAEARLRLFRVAAVELDSAGRIAKDVTATTAAIDIYRRQGRTWLQLIMSDAVVYSPETGQLSGAAQFAPPQPFPVPTVFNDNPKAMTRTQLQRLRTHPDEYAQVIDERQKLVEAIHAASVSDALDERMRADRRLELRETAATARTWIVEAARLNDTRFEARAEQPIIVRVQEHGASARTFEAQRARLVPAAGAGLERTVFDLVLEDVLVREQGRDDTNRRAAITLPRLAVDGVEARDLSGLTSADTLVVAASVQTGHPEVRRAIVSLERELSDLQHQITARLANRTALSVTACLLLVLGATMAMWLRGTSALATYTVAFLPGILDLILVSAGEQLLRDGRWLGWAVMWSGNALLAGAAMWSWRKLSRN